jgi:FtsH-binding integral membrane protein
MSYAYDYSTRRIAAEATADARAAFIRKTYAHLAFAILAFAGLTSLLVSAVSEEMMRSLFATRGSWILVLVVFMVVAYVADRWARSSTSLTMQYLGLGLYVVAESFIFVPILFVAVNYSAPDVIPKAGFLTLAIFAGLTFATFVTRQDFSFLRTILSVGSFLALGIVLVGAFTGWGIGLWFSAGMVVLACGFILYDTSNVLHHYRTDQHVAAALALFASVALLFYYVLRILMASGRR